MNKEQAEEFLKDLVVKIKASDKKETMDASPILFFIQEKIQLRAPLDSSEKTIYVYKYDSELVIESKGELDAYLEENPEFCLSDFEEIGTQEIASIVPLAFLTRESCQAHIDNNRHHYRHPETYSRSVWRDPMMKDLFEALRVIYE